MNKRTDGRTLDSAIFQGQDNGAGQGGLQPENDGLMHGYRPGTYGIEEMSVVVGRSPAVAKEIHMEKRLFSGFFLL